MSSNRLATYATSRIRVFAPLLALGLAASTTYGQTTAQATPRIQSTVNASQLVTLQGNTLPMARVASDHGIVPDSTPTGHMMLVLKRSDAQQKALDQLVASQQDPKSGSFHKWLTPENFGAQFGVADADVQTVSAYLSAQGFAVSRIYKNKMAIEFSGTTGQVRSAFRTEIHSYALNGQTFQANASDPQIPAALSPVVSGFAAMNNYKAPQHTLTQQMLLNRKTGQAHPLFADNNNQVESVSPGDLAVIYDIPTTTYTGTGVTVGVVGDSNINLAIAADYRTTFGLPANPPTVVVDGTDPGITDDAVLAYEQLDLLAATAPAANVIYYVSATTDQGAGIDFASIRAVEDDAVQVLVFGYEGCEQALGAGGNILYSTAWEQAAAQGISVIVGAGGGGAAECDAPVNGLPAAVATQGLAVNGYASTAFDTAVGASDFYFGPTGSVNQNDPNDPYFSYWSTDNSGTAGYTSAKRYIPEQPDNESNQATNQQTFTPQVLASGGGVSTLGLVDPNTFTQSPHPKPSYQSGFADNISTTARIVPDVSIFGGNLTNGSTYILCVEPTDCVNGTPDTLQYSAGGGTAASAATFGGITALLVQAKGAQGNLNPTLYATYAAAPGAFHDIAAGTNAVACAGGSPNCTGGFTSSGSGLAYQAVTGYDAASGLGSVDVANLISGWKNATATATVSVTLTQPGTNTPLFGGVHHGDPVQLNVSVTGTSGTPSGDVSITTTSPQPVSKGVEVLTLSNGQALDSDLDVLPGGSYQIVARYAGDQTFAPAVASVPITIFQASTGLDILAGSQSFANGATLPYGTAVHFTFEIYNPANANDVGTPTGSVSVTDNGKQLVTLPLNANGYATFQSSSLAAGAHSFFANYSGDQSFGGTSLVGAAPGFTIAGAPTTTTITATTNSLSSANGSLLLVGTVTSTAPGTTGAAPTGTVRFTTPAGKLIGPVSLSLGTNTGANPSATTAYTVKAGELPVGTTTIIATYVPDSAGNYSASSSSPITVNVGGATGLVNTTVALSTTPLNGLNFLNTANLNFAATVSGGTTPTGTMTFFANGTALGSSALDSTGAASFTVPQDPNSGFLELPAGQSQIFAEYSGDGTHAAAGTYYIVHVYGDGSTPDFAMQSAQTYNTISAANPTGNFTLQFTSLNGLAATGTQINLSVKAPSGISCSATPSGPNFGGTNYASLNLACGASSGVTVGRLTPPAAPHMLWMAEGGAALACVFLFGIPARRRSWQAMVGTLALIVVAFGITGCGANLANMASSNATKTQAQAQGPSATPTATGTLAPGSYTVVVTGTANVFRRGQPNTAVNVVHNLPLTVVVQ